MEIFINMFVNDDATGNRPHFKVTAKIDGVWHEAGLWPAKDGKKGFSGKLRPKQEYVKPAQETKEPHKPSYADLNDDQSIPF